MTRFTICQTHPFSLQFAKIFTRNPVEMFLFIIFFISRSVFAKRENVSSGTVYTRACNLSLHLCVPSTRLLAKCHGQHVVHVYTWLSERREAKWERNGDGEWWGSAAREPVTSNYTARFIIYCRQFLLPPRRCIRPAIEEWFVRRTRSRIHAVDQWGGTHRVSIVRGSQFEFLPRARLGSVIFFSSFPSFSAQRNARPFCGTEIIIITRTCKRKRKRKKKKIPTYDSMLLLSGIRTR